MKSVEDLKKECAEITKEIEKIGEKNNSHYVIDGIIDVKKYLASELRLMWILKEANSEDTTWSYLDNFKNKEWLFRCGNIISTLRRIIYTTNGILRGYDWGEIPDARNEKSFEPLQEIAFINIKKIPGGSSSYTSEIQQAYYENQELLRKQINTYDPNVVIFGNTMQFFEKTDFKGLESANKQKTDYGNAFYDIGDKLYIHSWHPGARGKGFTDEKYVMDLVNIVKNWNKNR